LTLISLSANEIGENGAKHLANAIRHNSVIFLLHIIK